MSSTMEAGRALTAYPQPLDPSVRSLFEFCNKKKFAAMDDEQLGAHITAIRDRAFKIAPWPCLGWYRFMPPLVRRAGVSSPNTYTHVVEHLQAHRDAKLLDFGCCFAHDARALVQDGVKPAQILNADLLTELIDMGFDLFADSKDSAHMKGMRFEQADVFKEEDIKKLEVPGGYYAIYVGSFIHLFPLVHQEKCVAVLHRLLSKEPGATIFGGQVGRNLGEAGVRHNEQGQRGPTSVAVDEATGKRQDIYVHDTQTIKDLFTRVTGEEWESHVETRQRPMPKGDGVLMMQREMAEGEGQIRLQFAMSRK